MVGTLVQLRVFFEDVGWTTIDDCEDYVLMIKALSPELSLYVGYTYIGSEAKLIVIGGRYGRRRTLGSVVKLCFTEREQRTVSKSLLNSLNFLLVFIL